MIDEIDEVIAERAAGLVRQGKLSRSYADEPFERRLARITAESDEIYWRIVGSRLHGRGIFQLMTNPKLLDLAESILGPEMIASSVYRLRPKLPDFAHGIVPWHQDSGYFEPYCDTSLILTVWIPFVEPTVERGCLEVIPRVYAGAVVRHRPDPSYQGYLYIDETDLPAGAVVPAPVPLGGALLLTNRTPHRSTENISEVIRWSIDLRY